MPASQVLSSRGRIAALSRSRAEDDPELVSERQLLATAKLEAYIERVVADAPPLSPEQRSRLTALLNSDTQPRTLRRDRAVDERIAGGGAE